MKNNYVQVRRGDAKLLNELKQMSKKGHSADVHFNWRDNKWIIYEADKHRKEITVD